VLPSEVDIDDGPLDYKPATTSFPLISDEMVSSIALGMEDELVVAARHNMSVEQYQELQKQPWFQVQVATKRADLEKNGVTFRAKAAWMAGDLLDQVYLSASSNDASLAQKHDVLKTLIKAGGLEPKDETKKDTGPTFAINIDLGGGQSISLTSGSTVTPQAPPTIDVETKELPDG
jgi:hypothetical protein